MPPKQEAAPVAKKTGPILLTSLDIRKEEENAQQAPKPQQMHPRRLTRRHSTLRTETTSSTTAKTATKTTTITQDIEQFNRYDKMHHRANIIEGIGITLAGIGLVAAEFVKPVTANTTLHQAIPLKGFFYVLTLAGLIVLALGFNHAQWAKMHKKPAMDRINKQVTQKADQGK
ncbi:MAG: hypothetical protein M1504_01220 [Candidatus Marsarchaeota archaeon]|nr:hypothetical protein [Candidatus Marsarchaeota archaeon]